MYFKSEIGEIFSSMWNGGEIGEKSLLTYFLKFVAILVSPLILLIAFLDSFKFGERKSHAED